MYLVAPYSRGSVETHCTYISTNNAQLQRLRLAWEGGRVVALVRHTAKCEHHEELCMSVNHGLTPEGVKDAMKIGQGFRSMGMDNADVKYSPIERTTQTAKIAFAGRGEPERWLRKKCNVAFEDKVREAHVHGKNTILVTHSACMNDFDSNLTKADFDEDFGLDKNFGIVGFVEYAGGAAEPKVLGCVLPNQWTQIEKLERKGSKSEG